MAMPSFTMRQLLEAGIHFGHKTRRWNPKVAPYLFGSRGGVHIIDLQQTVPMLHAALHTVRKVVAEGGKILFVGTKRQASEKVKEAAELCGQYYVNHRWLGGMLTNWKTVSKSISRLNDLDEQLSEGGAGFTKKELLKLTRERDKLDLTLGGIREMNGTPALIFVVDTNKEEIAIKEANRLNIPVVAIIDSNSNPDGVDYIIPGNDDATRAIELYCNLVSAAVLDGLQAQLQTSGADIGASEDVVVEIKEEDLTKEKSPAKVKATKKTEKSSATNVENEPESKKVNAKGDKAVEDEKSAVKTKSKPASKAPTKKAETKEEEDSQKGDSKEEPTKSKSKVKKDSDKKTPSKKTSTKKKDEASEAAEA